MNARFFDQPVLNSPYEIPRRHWLLDKSGQPTHEIEEARRPAGFAMAVPPAKQDAKADGRGTDASTGRQLEATLDYGQGISTKEQQYDPALINSVREHVSRWRAIPDSRGWRVTRETERLLRHWREYDFPGIRPFFCQVEAAETVIWLTEVAHHYKAGRELLRHLRNANLGANPLLSRLALKMATGAGKTTVIAMLIAWQTVNAVRHPARQRFTRGFLVVTPGITIRDRLRVLQPHDPDSYFRTRDLVPRDMLPDIRRAKIVITNYHAFIRRERIKLSKGSKALLQGRSGDVLHTTETEGQMLQRVMPGLMAFKRVMVFNDEGHHCYREKPESEEGKLAGDNLKEAKSNKEAARVWISGLEAVQRTLGNGNRGGSDGGILRVIDLSATPFFLRGSGYAEGSIFPWTMSDFSLMDAIECGIVKLPRVPVADNVSRGEMPKFRNLWDHIGKKMPKKPRGKGATPDPTKIPVELQTALEALYGHYEKTYKLWEEAGTPVPPCFIVVCNNTSTSKLVHDWIAGYRREDPESGVSRFRNGRLALFRNYGGDGTPIARPRTLLIDSKQLESGEALDTAFKKAADDELERFRREIVQRTGDRKDAEDLSDEDILREVMNTVGKPGTLGSSVRCVVSVSMLTEGWDANNVTHVLGVRAFGTQLLCEQVVGRALRRQSYKLNDQGLFDVEYADVLGIPFDFTAEPVVVKPQPPNQTIEVRAVSPERDACEIRFPRVAGYRVELPAQRLKADFDSDSTLTLTPELVGPTVTRNEGIIGKGVHLRLEHLGAVRQATLLYHLTQNLLEQHHCDGDGIPKLHLFGQLKRIVRQWLNHHLECSDGTYPAQLMHLELAAMACERINQGIFEHHIADRPVEAVLDPYNPAGSTADVLFRTSKKLRFKTDPALCHVNWAICDSGWEQEFCRVAEAERRVRAYVKNEGLGFGVPYRYGSEVRTYIPDFILKVDDGRGDDDLLHLVVEVKGRRREDAKIKKKTMDSYWIPGVNRLGSYGRWAFVELRDVDTMEADLAAAIDRAIERATPARETPQAAKRQVA